MKNSIKILLLVVVLTFSFIKVYVPLMSQEANFQKAQRAVPISKDIALNN